MAPESTSVRALAQVRTPTVGSVGPLPLLGALTIKAWSPPSDFVPLLEPC